ncbi:MAG: tRNA-specific 2-thiouridylase MnmA, partial [Actinomycetota bacterium]
VGHLTKAQVRDRAVALGLRTATKPDSQDVCFISKTGGRETFLGNRIEFRKAAVVTADGEKAGAVDALELVTIGQRKGLGLPGGGPKQFVVDVDTPNARVVIGNEEQLLRTGLAVGNVMWANVAPGVGERVRTVQQLLQRLKISRHLSCDLMRHSDELRLVRVLFATT